MRPSQASTRQPADLTVKRSVFRVFAFSLLSGGLYQFYWFYVTRKAVSAELNNTDQAGLQTLGLIVPILNLFITYWLYRDINILYRKAGYAGFSPGLFVFGPLLALFVSLLLVVVLIGLLLLPLVGLLGIVLYGLVISYLNKYWDKATGGRATEAKVTGGEVAVIVIGVLLIFANLALGVTGALLGGKKASNEYDLKGQVQELEKQSEKHTDPTAQPAPSPLSFSGTGQQATNKFMLQRGLVTFRLQHTGESNFIVELLKSSGTRVDSLVNEIGNFNGSKAIQVRESGEYLMNVSADGSWTITAE